MEGTWASAFDRLRLNTAVTAYETANGSVRALFKKSDGSLKAIQRLYKSLEPLSQTHVTDQAPIIHILKNGDDPAGRCYGLELNRHDPGMYNRYQAVIHWLLVFLSPAEILLCMCCILEGHSVGAVAEIIPLDSTLLTVFDRKGFNNTPSRYRIYFSCAGGLEKNMEQMPMLTGTYTFDFSKLFRKLPCFREIVIPEVLRGQVSFDLNLRQIDEVTVPETKSLASLWIRMNIERPDFMIQAMLADDPTIPVVDEGGVTKGLGEQCLTQLFRLFLQSHLPLEEHPKLEGVRVELPFTEQGRIRGNGGVMILHFNASPSQDPRHRLDEDQAQLMCLQMALSIALDVSKDSPISGLFWCPFESFMKEGDGSRTPQSCTFMRVTFMHHHTINVGQSKSRVRIKFGDNSGKVQHKHLYGSSGDLLLQQLVKMYLADVNRYGIKAVRALINTNPTLRQKQSDSEKSDFATPYTSKEDRYKSHLFIPSRVRAKALSVSCSLPHQQWALENHIDPSILQISTRPTNMLSMLVEEVLTLQIPLKPLAELSVCNERIARRCHQCHAILKAGVAINIVPLYLCMTCSTFMIRRRTYERQEASLQHLNSLLKAHEADEMQEAGQAAVKDMVLPPDEVQRREQYLMSVWKEREDLLREFLVLPRDGFSPQASHGRRPSPKALDTRQLVREIFIQRYKLTNTLDLAKQQYADFETLLCNTEVNLLSQINADIQVVNGWLVTWTTSAVDFTHRYSLDPHSRITKWDQSRYPGKVFTGTH